MTNYHKELGFPNTLVVPNILVNLQYTTHALERREREGKHDELKVLPTIVRVTPENVFEVNTFDNIHCKKVSVRINYDFKRDIILVLELLSESKAKVITFWLNSKKDLHKNFNKDKYTIPNESNKPPGEIPSSGIQE